MGVLSTEDLRSPLPVQAIYCSPALRCRQTIECLTQLGTPCEIQYTDSVLERNMGLLEGMDRSSAAKTYPDLFNEDNKFLVFACPPDGESFTAFHARANAFLELCLDQDAETILVCSHNQFLKMLYCCITEAEITEESWQKLSFPFGKICIIEHPKTIS